MRCCCRCPRYCFCCLQWQTRKDGKDHDTIKPLARLVSCPVPHGCCTGTSTLTARHVPAGAQPGLRSPTGFPQPSILCAALSCAAVQGFDLSRTVLVDNDDYKAADGEHENMLHMPHWEQTAGEARSLEPKLVTHTACGVCCACCALLWHLAAHESTVNTLGSCWQGAIVCVLRSMCLLSERTSAVCCPRRSDRPRLPPHGPTHLTAPEGGGGRRAAPPAPDRAPAAAAARDGRPTPPGSRGPRPQPRGRSSRRAELGGGRQPEGAPAGSNRARASSC